MRTSTAAIVAAGPAPAGTPACAGDPDTFFPPAWALTPVTAPPSRQEQAALDVCADCPVRDWCLARDLEECTTAARIVGVRGGMRQAERRALHQSLAAERGQQ